MPWQNADGLYIEFPQDISRNPNSENEATSVVTYGGIEQIEIDVNFLKLTQGGGNNFTSDLDGGGTRNGFNLQDVYLPANSSVIAAYLVTSEAATGGTSFTIGTRTIAGAAIVDTGIFTATEGVIANVNTIGKRTYGAGALVSTAVGTAGVGTADAFVYITTTGTFTAGKARLIIQYINPLADAV